MCLGTLKEKSNLWHQRMGHASLHLLHKLQSKGLVRGLSRIKPDSMISCSECSRSKATRCSFPPKKVVSTKAPLELIHMDLCGPLCIQSKGGNRYIYVLVDDYSRFTWTLFLKSKGDAFDAFHNLDLLLKKSLGLPICAICSDNGTEFEE